MNPQKYKITTVASGQERHLIWDPATPCGIDHNFQWVIENTKSGIHLRYLGGKKNEIQKNSFISVQDQFISENAPIKLQENLQVKIQRLGEIAPAYMSPVDAPQNAGSLQQLISFSGIGKALIGSQPVFAAYVAYSRGRPIYTFFHNPDGYHVKPLLNGVRLKFKGQKSELGEIGKPWILQKEELTNTTIIRGSNWWRFNWVPTSAILGDVLEGDTIDGRQSKSVWTTLAVFLALFLTLVASVTLIPRTEKPAEPPKVEEPPVVQVIPPKFRSRTIKRPPAPPAPVAPKMELVKKEVPPPKPKEVVPPKPKEVVPPKPVAVAPPPAAAPAKKAPKPVKEPVAPPKPPAKQPVGQPKTSNAPKIINPNQPSKTTVPTVKTAGPKTTLPSAPSFKDQLKNAFSGVKLPGNAPITAVDNANPNAKANALFTPGAVSAAPTTVKPGYTSGNTQVGTMAASGAASGDTQSYGNGPQVAIGNSPPTFVPVDSGNIVVEEGLTKEEVGAVIHAHMNEIRFCHEDAMQYNHHLEGKLIVQFTINGKGIVEKVSSQSSTLPDRRLEACILSKLKTWPFPFPKGGIKVSVSYPFQFKTLERD
jgi:TonB family protein